MDEITGKELVGIESGGAAAAGDYIWLKCIIAGEEQTLLIRQEMVEPVIDAMKRVSRMAADERRRVAN